jgi:hypothetical protein
VTGPEAATTGRSHTVFVVLVVSFLLWLISHGVTAAAYILAGMMLVGWFSSRLARLRWHRWYARGPRR